MTAEARHIQFTNIYVHSYGKSKVECVDVRSLSESYHKALSEQVTISFLLLDGRLTAVTHK